MEKTFYSNYGLTMFLLMIILPVSWLVAICGGYMRKKDKEPWANALLIQFSNILTIYLLYYSFGHSNEDSLFFPVAADVVVSFLMIARACKCCFKESHKFRWSMTILVFVLLESGVMVYYHYGILEHEKDRTEWTCVAAFVQTLMMMASFRRDENELEDHSRFVMYMVGAVGLIFLNSFALGTHLILNGRNGEIMQKDLRVIIFPAECVFVLSWLAYLLFSYSYLDVSSLKVTACKKWKAPNCCKKPHKHRSNQNYAQDLLRIHELETLRRSIL
ncbi:uncharacterized protein LOC127153496 isoform X1 [Labeo rohita]|uniref:uncharacterized protein LOC127153496 isoform X1 n=1 Tax=Labeo rohita TaxID=84645 RepID=UPI0021E2C1BF|nr:uncharacterized protein LOC127153496 isoform X1 [Labeo rohita]